MKSKAIIALEMRGSELLMLEAIQKGRKTNILNFGRFVPPDESADDGLGRKIKAALRANGFHGRSLAFIFSDEFVEHKVLDVPSVSGAKLAAIVKGQSLKDSQLAELEDVQNRFFVRAEIRARGKDKKSVFSTNYSRAELGRTLLSMSDAGLEPHAAVSSAAALANFAIANLPDIGDGYHALLHIRDRKGHIMIFDKASWLFSREFKLTADYGEDFGAPAFGETETATDDGIQPFSGQGDTAFGETEIATDDGIQPFSGQEDTAPDSGGAPMLNMAIDEINRSVLYFRQNNRGMINEIVLCCDEDMENDLGERISEELGFSVRNLDPSEIVGFEDLRPPSTRETFALNVYLPLLALLAEDKPGRCPNLVPPEFLERRTIKAVKGLLASIFVAVLLAAMAGYAALAYSGKTLNDALEQKQDYLAERRGRFENLQSAMEEKKSLEKKALIFQQSLEPQPPWAEIFRRVSLIIPEHLVLTSMTFERQGDSCWISVSGEARADSPHEAQANFRRFYDNWNQAGCFAQTSLEPIRLRAAEDAAGDSVAEREGAPQGKRTKHKVLFVMTSRVVTPDESS